MFSNLVPLFYYIESMFIEYLLVDCPTAGIGIMFHYNQLW